MTQSVAAPKRETGVCELASCETVRFGSKVVLGFGEGDWLECSTGDGCRFSRPARIPKPQGGYPGYCNLELLGPIGGSTPAPVNLFCYFLFFFEIITVGDCPLSVHKIHTFLLCRSGSCSGDGPPFRMRSFFGRLRQSCRNEIFTLTRPDPVWWRQFGVETFGDSSRQGRR